MAKATPRKQPSRKRALRTEVMQPCMAVEGGIKLDLSIGMEQILKMVRTDARDRLVSLRNAVCNERDDAKRAYEQLTTDLNVEAQKLCQGFDEDPQANALATKVSEFTGESYIVCISGRTCDLAAQQVSCTVGVAKSSDVEYRTKADRTSYYGHSDLVSRKVLKPFSKAMQELAQEIDTQGKKIAEIESRVRKADRQLADLPNLTDRAESALIKAVASGRIATGADLLQIVLAPSTAPAATAALTCELSGNADEAE